MSFDLDAHSDHDDPLLSIINSDAHSNHDDPLLSIVNLEDRSSTWRSTPESHWGCPGGFGYGQGTPVFSCGCYRHNVAEGLNLDLHLELNNSDTNNWSQYVSMDYR
jgi:hypothetical protein